MCQQHDWSSRQLPRKTASLKSHSAYAQVPAAWREQLSARGVRTGRSLLHHSVEAADGTRKFLLQVCFRSFSCEVSLRAL